MPGKCVDLSREVMQVLCPCITKALAQEVCSCDEDSLQSVAGYELLPVSLGSRQKGIEHAVTSMITYFPSSYRELFIRYVFLSLEIYSSTRFCFIYIYIMCV